MGRCKLGIASLRLLAGASAMCAPAHAMAQSVDSAEVMSVLVDRLTFFNVQELRFGGILPSTNGGTVTVNPDGSRTSSGGVTLVGTAHQPARFAGRGTYNRYVRIRLTSSTIQLTGPGAPMTVSNFTLGSTPTNTALTTGWQQFRLGDPSGMFNFPVGARLIVNANQREGIYTGTFAITLDYL